jgi:hypothetical protein
MFIGHAVNTSPDRIQTWDTRSTAGSGLLHHMFQDLASKDDWPVAAGMMLADWDVIVTTSGDSQ